MKLSSLRSKLAIERHAARVPWFGKLWASIRARYGDRWDPESTHAKRLRALRYARYFLDFCLQDRWPGVDDDGKACVAEGTPTPAECEAHFENSTRELLVAHVDGKFATLSGPEAVALIKPARGPIGEVGMLGRWAARCGAFGETDADQATKRFVSAARDAQPERLARTTRASRTK